MADVRINGKRIPPLQTVNDIAVLIQRLETLAGKSNSALTSLKVNNFDIDIDNIEFQKMKFKFQCLGYDYTFETSTAPYHQDARY